jgi:hypothetical protein
MSPSPASHRPAPHPASVWALLFALAAGPAGWILQLVLDYGLSGYACYVGAGPRAAVSPTGWMGERAVLIGLNLAGLVLAVLGGLIAYRAWRAARTGGANPARDGRTRFMALCGVFSATGFGAAILFNTLEPFVVSTCWRIAA